MSKKDDAEDDTEGASQYASSSRDSYQKGQSLIPPTQLGKMLNNILCKYIHNIFFCYFFSLKKKKKMVNVLFCLMLLGCIEKDTSKSKCV